MTKINDQVKKAIQLQTINGLKHNDEHFLPRL